MNPFDVIKLKKNSLSKTQLTVCEKVIKDPEIVSLSNLQHLSEYFGVSKAAILRFCQRLGYEGYTEFRYELSRYLGSLESVHEDNTSSTIIQDITAMFSETVQLMNESIDEKQVVKLANMLMNHSSIKTIGIFNSALPCWQLKYNFLRLKKEINVYDDSDILAHFESTSKPEDLVIAFTVNAKSTPVLNAIDSALDNGSKVALVTMNGQTPYQIRVDAFIHLPAIVKDNSHIFLDTRPIFFIFTEMLVSYYSSIVNEKGI